MNNLTKRISELEKELSQDTQKIVLLQTVFALNSCLDKDDHTIAEHQKRVAVLAVKIAEKLNYSLDKIHGVYLAALIHDIGKLYVPSEVLNKPQHLSGEEKDIIRKHPTTAYDIVSDIEFTWPVKDIIIQHHELLDGSGYPHGLSGKEILDESKILTVADITEAVCSLRSYKESYGVKEAIQELNEGKGTKYDKTIVEACIEIVEDRSFSWTTAIPRHRLY
jgi:putative nucleotidyltransferase with HDIG domain